MVFLIAYTCKGIGGISETYTPSGVAALTVVLIAYTCEGAAGLAEVQSLTPLVAGRRWR